MVKHINLSVKLFFVGLLLMTAMLITSCTQKLNMDTYRNGDWKFQISYPKGWFITDHSAKESLSVTFSKEEYEKSVTVDAEAVVRLTCNTEFDDNVLNDMNIVESKEIKVNGVNAIKYTVERDNEILHYVAINQEDNDYLVLYYAKGDNQDYIKVFEEMLNTVKFN